MKKIYSLFAAAVCVGSINAQTLTQSNHAPVVGDSYQTINCSSVGINPGGTGAGQTWNYSTMALLTSTTTNNAVTVASTGSASSYPSASVAVQSGTAGSAFYSASASNLTYWGGNIIVGGQAITMSYTTPATHAVYPMNLGSTANGNVAGTLNSIAGPGTFSGTNTVTATGTGTIMLPGGNNFPNTLKVTTIKAMTFTISFGSGTYTQTVTDFYIPSQKYPILTISNEYINSLAGPTTETVVLINSNYVLGMKESASEHLNNVIVYPNPAKDNINLNFTNENADNASYELVNVLGQTVRSQNIPVVKGETLYNVNLAGIENGIYFIKLNVGAKRSVTKITVQ